MIIHFCEVYGVYSEWPSCKEGSGFDAQILCNNKFCYISYTETMKSIDLDANQIYCYPVIIYGLTTEENDEWYIAGFDKISTTCPKCLDNLIIKDIIE
jgi:hypothetical protein